jgi:hypothetical protein
MEPRIAGSDAFLAAIDGRRQLVDPNSVYVCATGHGLILSCARARKALVSLANHLIREESPMRSVLVSMSAVVLLAGAVSIAQAGEDRARGSADTQIIHDGQENLNGSKWRFYGHLESSNVNCVVDRVVKMFKRENGKFVFADKDRTDVSGEYATTARLPGEPPLKFTVKQKEINGVTCGADSIKPFSGP